MSVTKSRYISGPYLFDVAIFCHENQLDWVEEFLLPLLEVELKLRCFLLERDKPAGVSVTETTKGTCNVI